jgi:hypothetical protein
MPEPTTVFLVRHGQNDWIAWVGQPIPALADDVRWLAFKSYRGLTLQILGVNDTGDLYA